MRTAASVGKRGAIVVKIRFVDQCPTAQLAGAQATCRDLTVDGAAPDAELIFDVSEAQEYLV